MNRRTLFSFFAGATATFFVKPAPLEARALLIERQCAEHADFALTFRQSLDCKMWESSYLFSPVELKWTKE